MLVKLSLIIYILISFEVGMVLIVLPLTSYWDNNFFLYFLTDKLHVEWLSEFLQSRYMRSAVVVLGAINISSGVWEIYRFRDSVRAFTLRERQSDEATKPVTAEPKAIQSAYLPDQRPSSASSTSEPTDRV